MFIISYLIPPSHQTSSHYNRPNRLKLCANFMDILQSSWTGYKLHGHARTSWTLNLLTIFWQPSCSEPVLMNVVRTSLVWWGYKYTAWGLYLACWVHVLLFTHNPIGLHVLLFIFKWVFVYNWYVLYKRIKTRMEKKKTCMFSYIYVCEPFVIYTGVGPYTLNTHTI